MTWCRDNSAREDNGDLSANQFSRQLRQSIELTVGEAVRERHILALDVTVGVDVADGGSAGHIGPVFGERSASGPACPSVSGISFGEASWTGTTMERRATALLPN